MGVSTLSSRTLFLFFFFRMTSIATASSDVLIFKPRILDLTDKPSSIQNPKFFGAAFG
jgi:hypothetical protein